MIYGFDYETFYSDDYSIRDLGNWGYTHHPEFDAYLLTVEGEDGYEWAGNPKDFDWQRLDGQTLLAHNAGFEESVTNRLKELSIVPAGIEFAELFDTADLAAYLGRPRSLAQASLHLLGIAMDKDMRNKAKGKRWKDMTPEFQGRMVVYGKNDTKRMLQIWQKYSHLWPQWERDVSQMTRKMCSTGLPTDADQAEEARQNLEVMLWQVRTRIPWATDPDAPALSPKLVAEECRKQGIPPPKSMAKDSESFDEWLRVHGENCQWAYAIGQYRRINSMLKKVKAIQTKSKPDGTMIYGLKYGGAHTMRDSGDSGFNVQNPPRVPFFFTEKGIVTNEDEITNYVKSWKNGQVYPEDFKFLVDLRSTMIKAPDGYQIGVVDLAAIEPCVLAVFADDKPLLELLHKGMDIYEAHARITGRYDDPRPLKKADKELRQYMKVEVLGLGYGAGPDKGVIIAKQMAGLDIKLSEMTGIVERWRANSCVPALWRRLEQDMRFSAPGDYEMELPSGRIQRYRKVQTYHGLTAEIPRLGKMLRVGFWGGSLTENLTQGGARDVFMDRCLALKNEGLPPILRCHDEAVMLFKEDEAEDKLKLAIEIMSKAPEWMPDLPISAEGHLCKNYTK